MSSSKIVAERMMLDFSSILLALLFSIDALESNKPNIVTRGKEILEDAKQDIVNIEKDHIMTDSLNTYYELSLSQQNEILKNIINNIESGSYESARDMLKELAVRAEEKMSEQLREGIA